MPYRKSTTLSRLKELTEKLPPDSSHDTCTLCEEYARKLEVKLAEAQARIAELEDQIENLKEELTHAA